MSATKARVSSVRAHRQGTERAHRRGTSCDREYAKEVDAIIKKSGDWRGETSHDYVG